MEGVQKAAQRYLHPDSCTVLVVGDKEQVASTLAPLAGNGQVLNVDINGDIVRNDPSEGAIPAPEGMSAQTVLDTYIKAIGGKAAMEKVKALRKTYATTVQGMTATMAEYNQAPNLYAMEMKMGEMLLQKIAFNGTRGKVSGMAGEKEITDSELDQLRESAYAFPELHYAEMEHTTKLLGIVDVNGQKAYRVHVNTLSGGQFDEYYDVKTGLKLRRKENQAQDGGATVTVTTDYSDYKPVAGVLFPYVLIQKGGMDMTLKATSIEVNKAIDAAVFSVD